MAKTATARFTFTVKQGRLNPGASHATVYIVCEGLDSDPAVLGPGFLTFELADGTTIGGAKEIANYLNSKIEKIGYTDI